MSHPIRLSISQEREGVPGSPVKITLAGIKNSLPKTLEINPDKFPAEQLQKKISQLMQSQADEKFFASRSPGKTPDKLFDKKDSFHIT